MIFIKAPVTKFIYYITISLWVVCSILPSFLWGQSTGMISGKVKSNEKNEKLPYCTVYLDSAKFSTQADDQGKFNIGPLPYGKYTVYFQFVGYEKKQVVVDLSAPIYRLNIALKKEALQLNAFEVKEDKEGLGNMKRMRSIEGLVISEGKKNEVIQLKSINANKATNQGRQIYAGIPGLNIWESDGAGIQLGIGGRGIRSQ